MSRSPVSVWIYFALAEYRVSASVCRLGLLVFDDILSYISSKNEVIRKSREENVTLIAAGLGNGICKLVWYPSRKTKKLRGSITEFLWTSDRLRSVVKQRSRGLDRR